MYELIPKVGYKLLQFGVMLGSDVCKHEKKQTQRIKVLLQIVSPLDIIHVAQVNLGFLASDENTVVLFVEVQSSLKVKIVYLRILRMDIVDGINCFGDQFFNPRQCETERIDGTFQTL